MFSDSKKPPKTTKNPDQPSMRMRDFHAFSVKITQTPMLNA
jgi:hypothetical protein